MRLRGATVGALNLFRTEVGTMNDEDLAGARAFADVATLAILQHQAAADARQLNEQLNQALNGRVTIEQAEGVLAERSGLDVDEVFVWLRSHAAVTTSASYPGRARAQHRASPDDCPCGRFAIARSHIAAR